MGHSPIRRDCLWASWSIGRFRIWLSRSRPPALVIAEASSEGWEESNAFSKDSLVYPPKTLWIKYYRNCNNFSYTNTMMRSERREMRYVVERRARGSVSVSFSIPVAYVRKGGRSSHSQKKDRKSPFLVLSWTCFPSFAFATVSVSATCIRFPLFNTFFLFL